MKTTSHRTTARLLFAACLASPLGLVAAPDPGMTPADPVTPAVVAPAPVELPPMVSEPVDLNRPDAVNLRLSTRIVVDTVENAEYTERANATALARRGAEEGRDITSSLKAGAQTLGDDDRKDLETAVIKAEQERNRLVQALGKATDANESRWSDVREEIAERYEKYAGLLEDAREMAVDGGVRFQTRISRVPADPMDASRG